MISARGRAMVGALALVGATALWGLAGASPAAAYVCGFGVDSPGSGAVSSSPTVRLRGPFEVIEGLVAEDRVLEVTFTSAPGPLPPPVTRSGDAVGTEGRYEVPLGPLARNGRYSVRLKATHAGQPVTNCASELGPEQRDTERTVEASFGVSVKASPPANVKATFNSGPRTAVVRWDKSGDPDIAGYTVTRKVGSAASTSVSVPPDPLSWTDAKLPATDATITYSVQAVRNGATPGSLSEPSDAVAAAALKVPAPPANTTAPPGTVATAPGTTVPFVLGPPLGDPLPTAPAPAPDLPPADGGYVPFDPSTVEDQPVLGADAATGPGEGGDGESIPQLAYVAAGLLSTVAAAHVLWLRRQALQPAPVTGTRATPLEPLEPLSTAEPLPPDDPPPEPTGASPFEPPLAAAAAGGATVRRGAAERSRPLSVDPPVILVPPRDAPERGLAPAAAGRRPLRADRVGPAVVSEPPEAEPEASSLDEPDASGAAAPPATAAAPADRPVLILRPRRPEQP